MNGDAPPSTPHSSIHGKEQRTLARQSLEPPARRPRGALNFKVAHVLASIFLLWLLAAHGLGIYFFATGFLLRRSILENSSTCSLLPDGSVSTIKNGCWHPKTFDKAVVVLIDALRYDFTVPFQPSQGQLQPSPYHNSLEILYKTATEQPSNAFLLPFIADPPTSTLQRLKGLTTGSLPTFIEIGSNFAGFKVEEDNLVAQLQDAGKVVVHLGDDTWHSLFPGSFDGNLSHAYDSFNVGDLHTVDNGVIEHIMPLLREPSNPHWDVIFAHFLGVDHAGHKYGPNHVAMTKKLQQMDRVMSEMIECLDDTTLLVVMGDHGMDSKGDHGGESDDEIEAAIWMYSKIDAFGRIDPAFVRPPLTAKERPVRQTDLVSTLSLLLGLPIPFGNLGAPIDEAFTGSGKPDWENLAQVNHLTLQQIARYQNEYSLFNDLEVNPRQYQKYHAVREAVQHQAPDQWRKVYQASRGWHEETLAMYRQLWANFDVSGMILGVQMLTGSLIALVMFSQGVQTDLITMMPDLFRLVGLGIGFGVITGPLLHFLLPQQFTAIVGVLFGLSLGSILGAAITLYHNRTSLIWPAPKSAFSWMALIFTVSQSAGFAANSYTIHEDTILLLFLTTFGLVSCISALRQSSGSDRVLGAYQSVLFVLLTRVASVSRLCREEQMPGCQSTFYASSNSSNSAPWQLFIPFAIALILPEIIKAFYKGTASYEGSAGFWIGFCFRLGLLLVALFWAVDAASTAGWLSGRFTEETLETTNVILARCAFAIAIPVGLATYIWAKPCINIFITEKSDSSESSDVASGPKKQLTILGYANAHGTRYFLLLPTLVLLTAAVLPPMGQYSIAICTWQILCLLEILDTTGLMNLPSQSSNYFSSSAIGPIILAMLGSYHFFKTGHQATLSSIQWGSAFVGFRALTYPWAPILIVLNTFGPQILCAAAVPLTVLWKRPISKSEGMRRVMGDVTRAMLTHVLYYATVQLATTMWAGHLRRHLMLYRVFMPRYLMATAVLVVVDIVMILIGLVGVRISSASVGEVFGF